MTLHADTTQILVIDFQEKLLAAMPPERQTQAEKTTGVLGLMAETLGLPVVITEQYPKGLGPSLPWVEQAFSAAARHDKLVFSAWGCEAARLELEKNGRRQVLVVGQETHVCVYQTVRDLLEQGFEPHVVSDGVMSRSEENRSVGLNLMEQSGAVITSLETALFDLVKQAGTDAFKVLSKAIR